MLFGLFNRKNINEGLQEYKNTSDALLIDVRTAEEYKERKIEGSINIPLDSIESIGSVAAKKSTPIFLYCRSGARSSKAAKKLQAMGYSDVKNIGGIMSYKG